MKIIFRVGVAVLQVSERRLLDCSFEELVEMMGPKSMHKLVPQPQKLIQASSASRKAVSKQLLLDAAFMKPLCERKCQLSVRNTVPYLGPS